MSRLFLTFALLACSFESICAEYIYMGGSHTFEKMGTDNTILHLSHTESAMLPVHIPAYHTAAFSIITDSPLQKSARGGISILLTTNETDTVRLTITAASSADKIYSDDTLSITLNRNAYNDEPAVASVPKQLHETDTGFSLCLDEKGYTKLYAGHNCEALLWASPEPLCVPAELQSVGVAAPENTELTVKRAMFVSAPIQGGNGMQAFTTQEVEQALNAADDPYSGYWTLLDYSLDNNVLRTGGDYMLALIPDMSDGYDIVYSEGAGVNPAAWQPGTLKGHLTPTRLAGVYRIQWIDAEQIPLPEIGTLQFSGIDLCTVSFPYLSSTFRLHRLR
ncbi:MAG: hypothetical protein NC402_04865 [Prevotella sp.]|nr:hypothetical protein [Prevotella sp.]MCM1075000.1 hypothetical protein [Ruminococcus sp.]